MPEQANAAVWAHRQFFPDLKVRINTDSIQARTVIDKQGKGLDIIKEAYPAGQKKIYFRMNSSYTGQFT